MILYDLEQQFDVYIIWTFFDIISNNKVHSLWLYLSNHWIWLSKFWDAATALP